MVLLLEDLSQTSSVSPTSSLNINPQVSKQHNGNKASKHMGSFPNWGGGDRFPFWLTFERNSKGTCQAFACGRNAHSNKLPEGVPPEIPNWSSTWTSKGRKGRHRCAGKGTLATLEKRHWRPTTARQWPGSHANVGEAKQPQACMLFTQPKANRRGFDIALFNLISCGLSASGV